MLGRTVVVTLLSSPGFVLSPGDTAMSQSGTTASSPLWTSLSTSHLSEMPGSRCPGFRRRRRSGRPWGSLS